MDYASRQYSNAMISNEHEVAPHKGASYLMVLGRLRLWEARRSRHLFSYDLNTQGIFFYIPYYD